MTNEDIVNGYGDGYATVNQSQYEILKSISMSLAKKPKPEHLMADIVIVAP